MSKSTPKQETKLKTVTKSTATKKASRATAPKLKASNVKSVNKAALKPKAKSKTVVAKTLAPKTVAPKTMPPKTTVKAKKAAVAVKPKTSLKSVSPKQKKLSKSSTAITSSTTKKSIRSIKPNTAIKSQAKSSPTAAKTSKTTLKDLHGSIASLETRMKRADTLTRKSVKALETAVTALDSRTRQKSSTDKATLTRKVNQLSSKLTDMVKQTQDSVNSDLKTALSNPSVENLNAALTRADQRLSQAEAVQAGAIAKINRHLASMANAVDARIAQEETARNQAIETLKTETSEKIDSVERDTAKALGNIGDKIVELSDEIKRRGEASELSIREKVSEVAHQTQTEFEQYKAKLDLKIDGVSRGVSEGGTGESRRLEHTIFALTNRLEELENSVADISVETFVPPAAPQAPPVSAPEAATTPPKLSVVATRPVTASLQDAFTPVPQKVQAIPANPYSATQTVQNSEIQEAPPQENHIPREFDPRQFMRTPEQPSAQPQLTPQSPAAQPPVIQAPIAPPAQQIPPSLENVIAAPASQSHHGSESPIDLPPTVDFAPQAYANPAYAETSDTMADVRIGGEPADTFKTPKLTGRNLRVAALATGVAVIGLVAAKGLLGNNEDSKAPQFAQNETTTAPVNTPQAASPVVIEPIGNYADNKAPAVTGEAANNLNSAAGAGDAVAQFQLGLSYLEQGRKSEGVDLIRKSANQNQPAAQYRLAKLYEVGEGVTQDHNMARQLTERAARNGNRIAMHDLALYYAEGRGGIKTELPTAAKWFEKAAERGVVDSQFNLGVLFESGQGLPKSMVDAFVWYSIAATQGDQFAKKRIDVLADTMTPQDLSAAEARIANFKPVKIDETANGIFRNVAWAKPDTGIAKEALQVKEVQSLLAELGYDIGGADGAMGPRTRAAIISFEHANGMPETGRVNTALLDRLELAAGA